MFEFAYQRPHYSLYKTIVSGQMFRFKRLDVNSVAPENGHIDCVFKVRSRNMYCIVEQHKDILKLCTENGSDIQYWEHYFNFDFDFDGLHGKMYKYPRLREVYDFSEGIVLLRQDPWETLVSFICSQNNNIPRIMGNIEKICEVAGQRMGDGGFSFPTSEALCSANLSGCGLGYREKYIYSAAEEVAFGSLILEDLLSPKLTGQQVLSELCRLQGVGPKVASCVALFGLGYDGMFPVDVWIDRAIKRYNITTKMIGDFGNYAGAVQQYLYYAMTP